MFLLASRLDGLVVRAFRIRWVHVESSSNACCILCAARVHILWGKTSNFLGNLEIEERDQKRHIAKEVNSLSIPCSGLHTPPLTSVGLSGKWRENPVFADAEDAWNKVTSVFDWSMIFCS